MLWYILLAILSIGLGFIILGSREKLQSTDTLFRMTGFMVLFLLGLALMADGFDYVSGNNFTEYYQYGNNFSGYHWDYDTGDAPVFNASDDPAFLFHRVRTSENVISEYDGLNIRTVGFFISILGGLGFMLCFFDLRREYIRGRDE